jgi:hypothetical protein
VLIKLSQFYRRPGNGYDVRDPDVLKSSAYYGIRRI